MRINFLLLIVFFNLIHVTNAQEDNKIFGYVVVQNSKTNTGNRQFLSNVSISSNKGFFKSQLTDVNGYFEIIISDKLKGENINLNIEKEGYELINEDLVANNYIGSRSALNVVMSRKDNLEKAYSLYYNFLSKHYVPIGFYDNITNSQAYKIDSLNQVLNEKSLEFERSISSINELSELKELTIQSLSRQLSLTNIDDLAESYRNVHLLITSGNSDKALNMLRHIEFKERLNKANALIKKGEFSKLKQKQDIEQLLIKARLEAINNNYKEAIKDLELGLSFDSENVDFLMELGYLNQILGNFKCLDFYSQAEAKTNDEFTKSSIYNNRAVYYKNILEYGAALNNYKLAEKIRKKLYKKNIARGNYAHTLNNIANLYFITGDTKKSFRFHKKALEISKVLFFENPKKNASTYFSGLINYASNLKQLGRLEDAKDLYDIIYQDIEIKFSELSSYEKAMFCLKYGLYFKEVDDGSSASFFLRKGISLIEKELDGINEFYNIKESKLKYQNHIPVLLGHLYSNLASVLGLSEKVLKSESYNRAILIYGFNLMNKEGNPMRYLGSLVDVQISYGIFMVTTKEQENIEFAKKNIVSAKENIIQLTGKNKNYINWGDTYTKLSLYYVIEGSKDSLKHFSNLAYDYNLDEFNKKPKVNFYKLLQSTSNLANYYLIGDKDDDDLEKEILRKLRFARKKFKKYSKGTKLNFDMAGSINSLIELFKNGVEFGEPKNITIEFKN
ncbi:hypothetical protein LCGC14_0354260 [marine sediment metagenome]|uniref:MalT-like TPR region domain-containing protein n=1 Tax=marine sediment metagenome TaxID=412755 RepID=A0A0F9VX09_9ZZZZ|nr:tetratricopeptide repeat protein [Maribacter sp.]HDZ04680.1 hypothetical protein [Maribacter sp.]